MSLRYLRLASFLAILGCAEPRPMPDPTPVSEPARAPVSPPQAAAPLTESFARLGSVEVGKPAPWFAVTDTRDVASVWNLPKALSGPRTTGVAVVFFATWCKPCLVGLKMIADARARIAASHVRVLLISVEGEPEKVVPFLSGLGLGDFPAAVDKFGKAADTYGIVSRQGDKSVLTLPRTLLIGRDQTVRAILGTEGPDYVDRLLAVGGGN